MKRPKGRGRIWTRGDAGFDKAVLATSFSASDPGYRPHVFVEANDIHDVRRALSDAIANDWQVSICSGGHSWNQNHLRDDGLLLSMSRFNHIEIDVDAKLARVGPGCWGIDLDRALRKCGLFFPVGHAPDIALGGYLLQGGFGWGSRTLGLATESVVGLDLMLADGQEVFASETEHSDLYWAARGAGPGFFAVVLRYHLKLHPRPGFTGMKMQIFRRQYLDEVFRWAEEVGPSVARSVEFQMLITPKALGIFKPGIEVISPVLAQSWGEAREAVQFVNNSPIRHLASFTTPLIPLTTSVLSQIANLTHFPPNLRWCADNMWVDAPVSDLLPGLHQIADTMPPAPSHSLWLNWHPPSTRPDMAFSLETKHYLAVYGEWQKPADDRLYQNWATEQMQNLSPFSAGIQLADENLARRPARFMRDENLAKLDAIRRQYDPEGLFRSWSGRPDDLER